jgi:hypothetical protein
MTVSQPDVSQLCITWSKPLTPNGIVLDYRVYFTPPVPPVSFVSSTESKCITNKQPNPSFVAGTNYSFWVSYIN